MDEELVILIVILTGVTSKYDSYKLSITHSHFLWAILLPHFGHIAVGLPFKHTLSTLHGDSLNSISRYNGAMFLHAMHNVSARSSFLTKLCHHYVFYLSISRMLKGPNVRWTELTLRLVSCSGETDIEYSRVISTLSRTSLRFFTCNLSPPFPLSLSLGKKCFQKHILIPLSTFPTFLSPP